MLSSPLMVSHGLLSGPKLQSLMQLGLNTMAWAFIFYKEKKKQQCCGCVIPACMASILLQCSIKAGFSGRSQSLVQIIWLDRNTFTCQHSRLAFWSHCLLSAQPDTKLSNNIQLKQQVITHCTKRKKTCLMVKRTLIEPLICDTSRFDFH